METLLRPLVDVENSWTWKTKDLQNLNMICKGEHFGFGIIHKIQIYKQSCDLRQTGASEG